MTNVAQWIQSPLFFSGPSLPRLLKNLNLNPPETWKIHKNKHSLNE